MSLNRRRLAAPLSRVEITRSIYRSLDYVRITASRGPRKDSPLQALSLRIKPARPLELAGFPGQTLARVQARRPILLMRITANLPGTIR